MSTRVSSSRSMVAVNVLIVASLGVGFLNNLVIAWLFGLTHTVDAFYAATVLPTLFLALCIDYLGKNFLPIYARARKHGPETASELASSVVTICALLGLAVAIVLAAASRPVFTVLLPGFDAAGIELVSRYFLIMAPSIVLSAVSPFHQYIHQHEERYTFIAAVHGVQPLANLVTLLAVGPVLGEYALPIAFTAGRVVSFALLAHGSGYRYRPRIRMRPDWEKKIFMNSAIVMTSGLLVRTRGLVGTYLSSLLGEGAISALALGHKLVEPLERTTFTGVRMLMFSRTARLVIEENARELSRLYRLGIGACFLLVVPALAWMCVEGELIVRVLFQRGAFDAQMTTLVALAIVGFAPSVLLAGVNSILSNAFYAFDRVMVPALVMPVGTAAYLAMAPNVYEPLGVLGLALSPSAAHLVVFLLLGWFLGKRLPMLKWKALLTQVASYVALAAATFGGAKLALARVELPPLFEAAASMIAGTALYFGVLAMLEDRTLRNVYAYFGRVHPGLKRWL